MAKGEDAVRLLREIRRRRGATLVTAADQLGITPGHLSRLERGEKLPSPEVVGKAARYYEIDEDLLGLEQGIVPEDVVQILRDNPEVIHRLREEYGNLEGS